MNEIKEATPEDVMGAILSFSDPNILAHILKQVGWTFSDEIKETVEMAKQCENLSVKLSAVKHLRELLKEAAETSGMVANVSRTIPGKDGEITVIHAKQMASALAPASKQIESKVIEEKENEQETETKEIEPVDGGSSGEETESDNSRTTGQDSGGLSGGGGDNGINREDGPGEGTSEGSSSPISSTTSRSCEATGRWASSSDASSETFGNNPCVDGKSPTGVDPKLFRGVTGDPETSADI